MSPVSACAFFGYYLLLVVAAISGTFALARTTGDGVILDLAAGAQVVIAVCFFLIERRHKILLNYIQCKIIAVEKTAELPSSGLMRDEISTRKGYRRLFSIEVATFVTIFFQLGIAILVFAAVDPLKQQTENDTTENRTESNQHTGRESSRDDVDIHTDNIGRSPAGVKPAGNLDNDNKDTQSPAAEGVSQPAP